MLSVYRQTTEKIRDLSMILESIIFAPNMSLILSMVLAYGHSNQSTYVVQMLIVKVVYRGRCALVHVEAVI